MPWESHSDRGKENSEQAVENDDQKDRFHDRCRGLEPERLGAAPHLQPLGAGYDPDDQPHEGRLQHPHFEMRERDRLGQARDVDVGAHAAVKPRHQAATIERGQGAQEGEHGKGDDQNEDPGQDEDLDGVEPHGAKRVDLLTHFHGAKLGRVGAARAACDHDGNDQDADLAQDQNADEVDGVKLGAELAEMKDPLLGDNPPDQKGDEENDGDGCQATRSS